jgi:hypothetical protein
VSGFRREAGSQRSGPQLLETAAACCLAALWSPNGVRAVRQRREHLVGGLLGEEVADIGDDHALPSAAEILSGLTTTVCPLWDGVNASRSLSASSLVLPTSSTSSGAGRRATTLRVSRKSAERRRTTSLGQEILDTDPRHRRPCREAKRAGDLPAGAQRRRPTCRRCGLIVTPGRTVEAGLGTERAPGRGRGCCSSTRKLK